MNMVSMVDIWLRYHNEIASLFKNRRQMLHRKSYKGNDTPKGGVVYSRVEKRFWLNCMTKS